MNNQDSGKIVTSDNPGFIIQKIQENLTRNKKVYAIWVDKVCFMGIIYKIIKLKKPFIHN